MVNLRSALMAIQREETPRDRGPWGSRLDGPGSGPSSTLGPTGSRQAPPDTAELQGSLRGPLSGQARAGTCGHDRPTAASPLRLVRPVLASVVPLQSGWSGLLATSLFEDPAAGLHEMPRQGSLSIRLFSLLDLGPVLAAVQCGLSPGSRLRLRGGHRGHHRERPDSRDTAPRDRRRTPTRSG
jgi:hypothetical protein